MFAKHVIEVTGFKIHEIHFWDAADLKRRYQGSTKVGSQTEARWATVLNYEEYGEGQNL